MDNASQSTERPLTDDQRAIREYFESAEFRKARGRRDRDLTPDLDLTPELSFVLGLVGLNLILVVFAALSPLVMYVAKDMISRSDGFFLMMAFVQTVMLPPLVSFSFAAVVPMFWYGSVLLRFATGLLMVTPGCVAFYAFLRIVEGAYPDDFWFQLCGVMFSQFLVAGAVALVVQMWSPWTLTHQRDERTPLPPLGTLAMLELTGVAAVGYTFFMTDGIGEIWQGLLFFAAMGACSSLAVIAVLIAFLREEFLNRISACLAVVASLAMSSLMCGFFAVEEFGWDSIRSSFFYFSATAVYGATMICGVMWLCVRWLRFCGWRCVNRKESRPQA